MKAFIFFLSLPSSANATPEFEGRGGEELGTEIANTLYRVFSSESSVDLKSLCINPREHCWVLYVDVLVSLAMKTEGRGGVSRCCLSITRCNFMVDKPSHGVT